MSNIEEAKTNIKSFTMGELKDIIREYNNEFAIKNISKLTTKDKVADALTSVPHLKTFGSIQNKQFYKELIKSPKAYEEFKNKKNLVHNIILKVALDKLNEKGIKEFLFYNYIVKGKTIPDNLNSNVKKIYKLIEKQWKVKQEKELTKLKNSRNFELMKQKEKKEAEEKLKKELEEAFNFQ